MSAGETRLEFLSAALLAVAVIATAYSAWQATRWSGVQAEAYASAGSLRSQSNAALSTANAQLAYDATTFGQFVFQFRGSLQQEGRLEEARTLADGLMRDEFLVYVDEWLALDPINDESAPQTPFELEDFTNASQEEADRLTAAAEERFAEAQDANQTSDDYVLATVFFATVLFFTGIATKFENLTVRGIVLALAFVGFGIGLWRMLTLPFE